jgi:hypothetical protein
MELSTAWDTLCYIAGAVSIVGPLLIIWFYVRTVRRRLKKFNEEHPV